MVRSHLKFSTNSYIQQHLWDKLWPDPCCAGWFLRKPCSESTRGFYFVMSCLLIRRTTLIELGCACRQTKILTSSTSSVCLSTNIYQQTHFLRCSCRQTKNLWGVRGAKASIGCRKKVWGWTKFTCVSRWTSDNFRFCSQARDLEPPKFVTLGKSIQGDMCYSKYGIFWPRWQTSEVLDLQGPANESRMSASYCETYRVCGQDAWLESLSYKWDWPCPPKRICSSSENPTTLLFHVLPNITQRKKWISGE